MRRDSSRSWAARVACLALAPAGCATAASLFVNGFEEAPVFGVDPPALSVPAGTAQTQCYYFRAPATPQAIGRISTIAGPGVAHLIVYATYDNAWLPQERQPPGTWSGSCPETEGFYGWLYAAHTSPAELTLPDDDGTGRKVAFVLAANQPLVLQVRLFNAGGEPLQTQVQLDFESRHPAQEVAPSASYVTDNRNLAIPPNSTDVESQTCAVPPAVQFWRFTARTYKQGTRLRVLDGATTLADGTDWEHPPVTTFDAPAFYTFGGSMTYECTYSNPTNSFLTNGSSEDFDELCLGIGWFFPAPRPMFCVNNVGPL